jgi:hypothetical protein
VPRQDKLALMEALYTKGPLAVSIDAGVLNDAASGTSRQAMTVAK